MTTIVKTPCPACGGEMKFELRDVEFNMIEENIFCVDCGNEVSPDTVDFSSAVIVERFEWMPVKVSYSVDIGTNPGTPKEIREKALAALELFDDGESSQEKSILYSRTINETNSDIESVRDIDEAPFWKVNGKTEYDTEEEA